MPSPSQQSQRKILSRTVIKPFPTFCAALVGGSALLRLTFSLLLKRLSKFLKLQKTPNRHSQILVAAQFTATFVAAWASLLLLNSGHANHSNGTIDRKPSSEYETTTTNAINEICQSNSSPSNPRILAGKTIDLTLLAATRALDVVVGEMWSRRKKSKIQKGPRPRLDSVMSRAADVSVFAFSSGMVMWAWFYRPDFLPRTYNKWIRKAAQVDERLLEALRRIRQGVFHYGIDTGQAPLLESMCADYGWPLAWGDPAKTIPIPCEMVHMGTGRSCEKHALSRFTRAFRFALATYLPLNLFVRARSPSIIAFRRALIDSVRSSAFLGAFISLFYYSVCLARTRLGPNLFSKGTVPPLFWDNGTCVGAGCMMCGWSILIEAEHRRQEVAFFVAPRAAATLFPRKYDRKYLWREALAFALSSATVLTCIRHKPERVRGVLGKILNQVLDET
ncbi:MAG: hypothetical protein M1829_002466 [Trizodia sp. TS-e1964]|nr:MAG: hypothetical protein M1829_002466 [Trizodia sp. TS-e1964]